MLIFSFARSSKTPKLRKEAIFWLGRRASKRALDVISDTIYNEADAQVQKHALHALSQFENDTAVPLLITIATEHPSVDVRKRAIYILGDSGDTRAVEALVDMARGVPLTCHQRQKQADDKYEIRGSIVEACTQGGAEPRALVQHVVNAKAK